MSSKNLSLDQALAILDSSQDGHVFLEGDKKISLTELAFLCQLSRSNNFYFFFKKIDHSVYQVRGGTKFFCPGRTKATREAAIVES